MSTYLIPSSTIGIDTKSGAIFCVECEDFVYNTTFNGVYVSATVSTEEKRSIFQGMYGWDAINASHVDSYWKTRREKET